LTKILVTFGAPFNYTIDWKRMLLKTNFYKKCPTKIRSYLLPGITCGNNIWYCDIVICRITGPVNRSCSNPAAVEQQRQQDQRGELQAIEWEFWWPCGSGMANTFTFPLFLLHYDSVWPDLIFASLLLKMNKLGQTIFLKRCWLKKELIFYV
jgi:hypothetical protein